MSSLRNISENDGEYKMSHSLFVIHVAFSSLILVAGVCVNTISVGHSQAKACSGDIRSFYSSSNDCKPCSQHHRYVRIADQLVSFIMFCRMTGFVVFVLIGVQMCNITLISISAYLKVSHSTLGIAFFQEIGTLLFVWVSFGSYHYVSCQCLQQNSGESSPSQTTRLGVTHSLVDSESLSSVLHW